MSLPKAPPLSDADRSPKPSKTQQRLNCLMCHGTGKNRRGGPCQNCRGTGAIILSASPTLRTLQLVGRTIGATVLMIQALAALLLALVVLAVIVVITLAIIGVHI